MNHRLFWQQISSASYLLSFIEQFSLYAIQIDGGRHVLAVLMTKYYACSSQVTKCNFHLFIINLLDHSLPYKFELFFYYFFAFSLPRHDAVAEISNIKENALLNLLLF